MARRPVGGADVVDTRRRSARYDWLFSIVSESRRSLLPSPTPQVSVRHIAQVFSLGAILAMSLLARSGLHAGAQAAIEGDVRLAPASSTISAGDGVFTVYVVLEGLQHAGNVRYDDNGDGTPDRSVSSAGLGAFQFTIEYDPAIVEFQSAAGGPSLGQTGRSFQCLPAIQDVGIVTFGCLSPGASPDGAQGTMTLASVEFSPRSNGLSPLVLSAEIAGPLGDRAEVDVGGGTVRVSGSTKSHPTSLPSVGTRTPGAPTPKATIGVTPSPAAATATAQATANGTPGGTPTRLATGLPGTPTPTNVPDGQPGGGAWWWVIGIGGALAAGGLGLMAILWRRRAGGSF